MTSVNDSENVRDIFANLHAGWTNPETYAAHLHMAGDEGLRGKAVQALRTAATVHGTVSAAQAGAHLEGLLGRYLDELDDAGLVDEHRAVRDDIGSMWRVNWTEIGAAFLGDDELTAVA